LPFHSRGQGRARHPRIGTCPRATGPTRSTTTPLAFSGHAVNGGLTFTFGAEDHQRGRSREHRRRHHSPACSPTRIGRWGSITPIPAGRGWCPARYWASSPGDSAGRYVGQELAIDRRPHMGASPREESFHEVPIFHGRALDLSDRNFHRRARGLTASKPWPDIRRCAARAQPASPNGDALGTRFNVRASSMWRCTGWAGCGRPRKDAPNLGGATRAFAPYADYMQNAGLERALDALIR